MVDEEKPLTSKKLTPELLQKADKLDLESLPLRGRMEEAGTQLKEKLKRRSLEKKGNTFGIDSKLMEEKAQRSVLPKGAGNYNAPLAEPKDD